MRKVRALQGSEDVRRGIKTMSWKVWTKFQRDYREDLLKLEEELTESTKRGKEG